METHSSVCDGGGGGGGGGGEGEGPGAKRLSWKNWWGGGGEGEDRRGPLGGGRGGGGCWGREETVEKTVTVAQFGGRGLAD
jgi:hypothetical protein